VRWCRHRKKKKKNKREVDALRASSPLARTRSSAASSDILTATCVYKSTRTVKIFGVSEASAACAAAGAGEARGPRRGPRRRRSAGAHFRAILQTADAAPTGVGVLHVLLLATTLIELGKRGKTKRGNDKEV
jgi:hypothetical protein